MTVAVSMPVQIVPFYREDQTTKRSLIAKWYAASSGNGDASGGAVEFSVNLDVTLASLGNKLLFTVDTAQIQHGVIAAGYYAYLYVYEALPYYGVGAMQWIYQLRSSTIGTYKESLEAVKYLFTLRKHPTWLPSVMLQALNQNVTIFTAQIGGRIFDERYFPDGIIL